MTKKELFAGLADAMHISIVPDASGDGRDCHECVSIVARDMEIWWPLIVDFVGEWIVSRPGLLPVQPEDLAHAWCKDMTKE